MPDHSVWFGVWHCTAETFIFLEAGSHERCDALIESTDDDHLMILKVYDVAWGEIES
jgi:hypothetical protein